MRASAVILAVLAIVMPSWGSSGSAPHVEAYLAELREQHDVPGVAVGVVDGELTRVFVHGLDGDGAPLRSDTRFLVGSVAKTFTATAVLRLVASDRIHLDDRVGAHVPYLERGGSTLRQLLSHTSGYTAADGLAVSERYDNRPGALRRAALDLTRSGRPGTFAYSSANYLLLGAVVEEVTGRPFGEHVEASLMAPLGMTESAATAEHAGPLPPGHRYWWGRPRPFEPGYDESGAPYGYVVSTLEDLMVWGRAHLAGDVLPDDLRAAAQSPQVRTGTGAYGLGWRVSRHHDTPVVHHTGATPGHFAHVLLLPGQERAVVVLANAYSEAKAEALGDVALDVHEILGGGSATPGGPDPLLRWVPWMPTVLAGGGVVALAAARRRPRGRARPWAAAAALGVVLAVLAVPTLVGYDLATLWTWFPDAAVALVAAAAAWTVTAVALALPRRRAAAPSPALTPTVLPSGAHRSATGPRTGRSTR